MSAANGAVVTEEHKNFFSNLPYSWPEVTQDGKIETMQFLNAASGIIDFFGLVGKVFNPIKYDISGNIEKLKKKYAMDPERYKYLNDMILMEKEKREDYAIESLLWLKRALLFVSSFLHCIIEDHDSGKKTESLVSFSQKAYEESLKKYHGWMVQKLHQLISRALPWRRDFMKTLADGKEGMDDIVVHHMREFVAGMDRNLTVINDMYLTHGLDSDKVV